ncbi:MAG: type II toxin-antitoxin system RelE/ParE family toxin [Deltaproteobacteria bacterium]|nr:type II toxin-antitoxin system RelE/ParE family toxin [Deltaproteobacteria bacterium]
MSAVNIIFYKEGNSVPILEFMEEIPRKASAKGKVRLDRLAELGNALRRPEADFLRDGIYELRWHLRGIQYRLLYFFHGREAVVLSHGIIKQASKVPLKEIELALKRKITFEKNPAVHSYSENN